MPKNESSNLPSSEFILNGTPATNPQVSVNGVDVSCSFDAKTHTLTLSAPLPDGTIIDASKLRDAGVLCLDASSYSIQPNRLILSDNTEITCGDPKYKDMLQELGLSVDDVSPKIIEVIHRMFLRQRELEKKINALINFSAKTSDLYEEEDTLF